MEDSGASAGLVTVRVIYSLGLGQQRASRCLTPWGGVDTRDTSSSDGCLRHDTGRDRRIRVDAAVALPSGRLSGIGEIRCGVSSVAADSRDAGWTQSSRSGDLSVMTDQVSLGLGFIIRL